MRINGRGAMACSSLIDKLERLNNLFGSSPCHDSQSSATWR
ncbi:MAG: hypothetical protein WCA20_16060 [Candidatus Sulfotelmatobacter sp.]